MGALNHFSTTNCPLRVVHLTEFRLWVLSPCGATVKTETGYQFKDGGRCEKGKSRLIHAYLSFTLPSNAIDIQSESSNLFSIVCVDAFINICMIFASN